MKYVSIDIETTGLNPKTCDVLEVGMYLEDTCNPLPREQTPSFHKYIWKDVYRGEAFALQMNQGILKKIANLKASIEVGNHHGTDHLLITPDYLWDHFSWWIYENRWMWKGTPFGDSKDTNLFFTEGPKLIVAGKNVMGFDLPFLKELGGIFPKFAHRTLDPGPLFTRFTEDEVPPDLKECKKRAGLPELVTHDALDDAWDVITLLRTHYDKH